MTKLEAALRRILRGAVTAPDEKWLVFSAFEAALGMLHKALIAKRGGRCGAPRGKGGAPPPPPPPVHSITFLNGNVSHG